jgi:cytochrome c biogenesis protein CcmG/thiol:disulfide interchange protein DsbE
VAEAPQLKALADAGIPIVGIAVRDRPEAVQRFLARNGNPFRAIGADDTSQVQMAFGSSGVPESFVVDGKGMIRQQTIGPINPQDVPAMIAAVRAAR